jgi:hypothetical protein
LVGASSCEATAGTRVGTRMWDDADAVVADDDEEGDTVVRC